MRRQGRIRAKGSSDGTLDPRLGRDADPTLPSLDHRLCQAVRISWFYKKDTAPFLNHFVEGRAPR